MKYSFTKMNGVGNDFVIFDGRTNPVILKDITAIADRRTGVGCDQVIILNPPNKAGNDTFMNIYNANNLEVDACGNATRCVGWLIGKNGQAVIETNAGVLLVDNITKTSATAHMGQVKFGWQDIPLSRECDTAAIAIDGLPLGSCASIGNPHIVFFTNNIDALKYGPLVENHPLFPQKTNVEFAQILSHNQIKVTIWERGVGETDACGTGACAVAAIAHKQGLTERKVIITSKGGDLIVELDKNYNAKLTGDVAVSFTGEITTQ